MNVLRFRVAKITEFGQDFLIENGGRVGHTEVRVGVIVVLVAAAAGPGGLRGLWPIVIDLLAKVVLIVPLGWLHCFVVLWLRWLWWWLCGW